MTVTMDHKSSRKSSWDSKMSVSTVSSATRQFRRSPSSIISSDSDIRFTRKKLSSSFRCGCCIVALFLLFLLLAAGTLYVAYTFFMPDPLEDQVFRAMFRVVDSDTFTSEMADPATESFRIHSEEYQQRLNSLFLDSGLRRKFKDTEVLALDGIEGKDLVVHFNVIFDPSSAVEASEVVEVLYHEISSRDSPYFTNLTIDSSSLDVQKNYSGTTTTTALPSTKPVTQASTNRPPPPRQCSPVKLKYCTRLSYNVTSYPNILGHTSIKEVEEDVIAFRELVDAECYRQAYDFVCQVLQPACIRGKSEDISILPCRSFCRDFMAGCGSRLLPKLKEHLDCNRFPEFSGTSLCSPKPECVLEMQQRALSPRICDGVVDCQDLSDEKLCTYCPSGYVHCGIGRACVPAHYRCDGKIDCPDGGDERACLSISPTIGNVTKLKFVTPHLPQYHTEGYVVFNEKGQVGKVCTENVNNSIYPNRTDAVLQTVASSLCSTLSFQKMTSVQIKQDEELNVPYVRMKDPSASEITFVRTSCPSKQVLHVGCSDIECGFQSVHGNGGIQILNKMAGHGDWPWHAALFKEDVHVCDGTLVSSDWLVTTASCFQGQPKAEWTARLGTVRLAGTSPWQQERRIIGLVKSPVEGSTIAMVKLEEPVHMSDFVRPICLPKEKSSVLSSNMSYCNTLGWARNREQLQRVQLKISEMEKCENVSIKTVNSLCTEAAYSKDDCNEEELAGSPMLCLLPDGVRWSLVGVSNWRIACSKIGVERPRMYDKITSNVDWIHQTISAIS